jgi:DNA modification methylase
MAQIRCLNEAHGDSWCAVHGDCVDVLRQMPENSIDFSVFSPPFMSLYVYSESAADMGNSASDAQFLENYGYFVRELYRVMRPGRIVAVHCKDLVFYKNQRGTAGLRDFPGMLIRAHENAGFTFHSRVTIWRDPVMEMQKTKSHGLLYKQLRADSTFSRQGLPEYFVVFRKWATPDQEELYETYGELLLKVRHEMEDADFVEVHAEIQRRIGGRSDLISAVTKTKDDFPVEWWQEAASPVWMNTRTTDVLNAKRLITDEKHICPMPLDLTTRATVLWSNPGDVVLSPFMGIGSEGYVALKNKRRFVGVELKKEYWEQAARHLDSAERNRPMLFDQAAN